MPLANYGADNPAASDPWPIESTLAPIALGGDQMQAQGMLDSYRLQRQAATNAYQQNLEGQHDFAYQQLAQQLAEARMKIVPELLGKPGGAHLLGAGGIPGMDMGTDPSVMQGVIGAADRAQAATNLEHAGAGLASTTAAGFQPSTGQASVATGGFSGPQGDPTAIGVAKLKLQGDLARAAASAGNKGLGISFTGAANPALGGVSPNITVPKGWTLEQAAAEARKQGLVRDPIQPPSPNAQPGTPGALPNTTPPGGRTGLANAPGQTPPADAPGRVPPAIVDKVHQAVQATPVTPQNQQKMADIKSGYVNGRPNVVAGPNGLVVVGASKKQYRE